MKGAHYFLFFLILLISFSCVRKSGRRNDREATNKTEIRKPDRESRKSETKDEYPTISKSTQTSKVLTGSTIFEKYNSAVFMIFTSDGLKHYQGSGFFLSNSGLAVSNYHVFEGTTIGYEQIKLTNNDVYKIKRVIARSKENDFILFEVENKGTNFNYIPLETKEPKVGEKVFAIGSPRGLENTFSSGEISQVRGESLLQINVPIDHGSSGGALINEYGNAVGITMGGYDDSGANLNFAVNTNVIKPFLQSSTSNSNVSIRLTPSFRSGSSLLSLWQK